MRRHTEDARLDVIFATTAVKEEYEVVPGNGASGLLKL
jgi:hypothetical protein